MKEDPVTIPSGELKLEGLLYKPAQGGAARAAVVCHPHPLYGGSMYNNVVDAALDALWKLGFATLRFNFRGVGMSAGEHSGGPGEIEDAKAAMNFILSQPGVARDGAVMAGYSFGAAVAIRSGAEIKEVGTLVAIALPVAMGGFSAAGKSGKSIVLLAGDRDAYCPEREVAELAKSLGQNASLRVIRGADHFFSGYEKQLSAALAELLGG